MYHAPVNLDLEEQDIEPAELADESVGADPSSHRLREAHLHKGQALTRALFAPFFSITAVGGALLVAWAMFGGVRLELVGGWVASTVARSGRRATQASTSTTSTA